MNDLSGFATGIGSVPFKDADQAVDLILKHVPNIPFWPQLAKRDLREGMVAQYSENLPCLKVTDDGVFFDPRDTDSQLETFYEKIITQDVEHFMISEQCAQGLYAFREKLGRISLDGIAAVKCHVTGPYTFAGSLNNDKGVSLVYDDIMLQAIVKGLVMKALWQIRLFKQFGKPIVIFFDEPYLGVFGSAYTPLDRTAVVNTLSEFTQGIKEDGVSVGVHCCGNTDWSIFTDVPSIDIINFDAFGFVDKVALYAGDLQKFLARGGKLCWGVVPTQNIPPALTVQMLLDRLDAGMELMAKRGVDRGLLRSNLLISPSCGLGTLDETMGRRILEALGQLSEAFRAK